MNKLFLFDSVNKGQSYWIHISFISVLVSLTPFLAIYASKNPFVKRTLCQGWSPIITAMLISRLAFVE